MKNNSVMLTTALLSSALFATNALAAFQVQSEYQSAEPYGNAQTACFRGALTGSYPLTPAEEAALAALLPLKEVGHYYGRMGLNAGQARLDNFRNTTQTNAAFVQSIARNAIGVSANAVSRGQSGLEMALGYVYSKAMRLELEFMFNQTFRFNNGARFTVPTINAAGVVTTTSAPTGSFSGDVKNITVLFNGYYEYLLEGYDRFRPFLMAGLGIAYNTTTATMSLPANNIGASGGTFTRKEGSFAAGLGLGFRYRMSSRLSIYATLRYLFLGTPQFGNSANLRIRASYAAIPFSLGLMYLF